MSRRRGFFAEMQYQAAKAEKERQRRQIAANREADRAAREYERAQANAQRAAAAASRAAAQSRDAAEKEAKRLHQEAMTAQAAYLTEQAADRAAEIQAILSATLDVDDFVDLDSLRQKTEHPPFESRHSVATPPPRQIVTLPEPIYTEPTGPRGVKSAFGGKRKHEAALLEARADFERTHAVWREQVASVPARQLAAMQQHAATEGERRSNLEADRARYEQDCTERQASIDRHNRRIQAIQDGVAERKPDAVEEYFSIVLGNSVYPEGITVDNELKYEPMDKELTAKLFVSGPEVMPTARSFRYVKNRDEVVETSRSAKDLKDLYSGFIHQVTLRTLHEIWESDRTRAVESISLVTGVENIDPATGRDTFTPLVGVATSREHFLAIDLSRATPVESLKYLKSTISKDPTNLVGVEIADRDIRA